MGKNVQQRRGIVLLAILCAIFWGIGVGHTQAQQEKLLNSPNRVPSSNVEVSDVPGNADKSLPMITKNPQRDGCLKTQGASQLVRLESHDQTWNNAHQELIADNIKIIDLDLQAVINAQWSGMMQALKEEDVEETLRFISTNQRETARNDWAILDKLLGNMAENFSEPLHVTAIDGNQIVAQAMMPRPRHLSNAR